MSFSFNPLSGKFDHSGPRTIGAIRKGSFTTGSILFAGATYIAEDNANLFWDDTTNRLGIGISAPTVSLDIQKDQNTITGLRIYNAGAGTSVRSRLSLQISSGSGLIQMISATHATLADILYIQNSIATTGHITFNSSSAEVMRITAGNAVGIGTSAPSSLLDVLAAGVTAGTHEQINLTSNRAAIVSGNLLGGVAFRSNDTTLTAPGNVTALIQAVANETHTATALGTDIVWQTIAATTTTLSEKMRLRSDGKLGVGATHANYRVFSEIADASSLGCYGARINTADANITAADTFMDFLSSGGAIGSVVGTAVAGVIAYNTFSGAYWSQGFLPEDLLPGSVLISINALAHWKNEVNSCLPKCALSEKAKDKRVYGVYGGTDKDGDHIVLALGAGVVRVCNEGGNIEVGDLLCTSSIPGCAMKYNKRFWQSYDPSVILGKARESFSGKKSKTIACSLYSG